MKAIWNDTEIANSAETVLVEGNHYFPSESVNQNVLRKSDTQSRCAWKGTASYYDIVVENDVNKDAAWYYPNPLPAAQEISGHVAFWRGVVVTDD